MPIDPARYVSNILLAESCNRPLLLQYLVSLQSEYRHIPAAAISALSSTLEIPESEIIGVIEFYSFLHLKSRGQYDILFSDSITDHMLGSRILLDQLCQQLNVEVGQVRADQLVSVNTTSCTGMCDQGPALLVNGIAITNLDEPRISLISQLVESGADISEWSNEFFTVRNNIRRKDILLSCMHEEYDRQQALQQLVDPLPADILNILQSSGLRGRGGAGFPTARKWRDCRDADAARRYVICNADEGEPGTFKDRVLLQSYAHQLIEGMTLCGHAVNATHGLIYLRGEYRYLLDHLQAVIDERRTAGLLGNNILGKRNLNFDVDIHLGAGAYICGEESALIESLEGKRGIPRKRPPFPCTYGYLGEPSVVNNVETFIAAAQIIIHGAQWFSSSGTEQSSGTKLLSISGDCKQPGIYEYPFGTTVRQILQDCGATNVQAVQIAGAAGTTLPPDQFDRVIAFEDLGTGGSFIIFNQQRKLLDMVQNFAHFFVHESCGFCTPCRVGGSLLKDLVDKVYSGHGSCHDLDEMKRIAGIMRETSFCGLGATAPSHVLQTLDSFSHVYVERLSQADYEPAFDLDAALAEARRLAPHHCKSNTDS